MIIRKPFYIMRHGESTDNEAGIISGAGSDPHLTKKGQYQAQEAARILAALSDAPQRVIASALIRTHQTARFAAPHIDFIIEPDMNERHLGELDGKISEAEQKKLASLPGEESGADHLSRVVEALNRHLDHENLTLFVCHGGTIRRVMEAAGVSGIIVENARLYYFEPQNGGWSMEEIS